MNYCLECVIVLRIIVCMFVYREINKDNSIGIRLSLFDDLMSLLKEDMIYLKPKII